MTPCDVLYTDWTKKDSEKAELFRKVKSYLTFLNIPELENKVQIYKPR